MKLYTLYAPGVTTLCVVIDDIATYYNNGCKHTCPFSDIRNHVLPFEQEIQVIKTPSCTFVVPNDTRFPENFLDDYKPPSLIEDSFFHDYDHAAEQAADDNQRRMEEYYERQLDLNSR